MTREEAIKIFNTVLLFGKCDCPKEEIEECFNMAIKALEQEPCEMTAEEYRQRMIQAFHNADTDELIAICALPTEKEFEHLEWLLKNHYKKEPCEDCVSRIEALNSLDKVENKDSWYRLTDVMKMIQNLPSVTPQQKTGYWIDKEIRGSIEPYCSVCGDSVDTTYHYNYCPNCGATMVESEG